MASTVYNQYRTVAVTSTPLMVATGFCTLVGWNLINPNSTNAYLKIYNVAEAFDPGNPPACSRTLLIPANGTAFLSNEDKFQLNFSLGMCIWVVTGIADSDATAPSTGCYVELLYDGSPAN